MSRRAELALREGSLGADEPWVRLRLAQGFFSPLALEWLDILADPRAREGRTLSRAAHVQCLRLWRLWPGGTWRLFCGELRMGRVGTLTIDRIMVCDRWGRLDETLEDDVVWAIEELAWPAAAALQWHKIGCVSCGVEEEEEGICEDCRWKWCIKKTSHT